MLTLRENSTEYSASPAARLEQLIETRAARVGVIGLGYVGLPLAIAAARARLTSCGLDIDDEKVSALEGQSYIDAVPSRELSEPVAAGRFSADTNMRQLG